MWRANTRCFVSLSYLAAELASTQNALTRERRSSTTLQDRLMAFEVQMTRHDAVRADRVTKDNTKQTRAQVQAKALAQTLGQVAADTRAREDEDEEKKREKEEEDTKRREVVAATLSPLPSLKAGDRVTVAGTSRDDLNGQCGTVKSFDASKERFNVNLDTGRVLALRGVNLVAGLLGRSSLRDSAESGTQTHVSQAEKDGDDVGSLMRVMMGRHQQQQRQQQQQQHVSAPPQPPPDRIGVMQKKGGLRHNWTRRNFCLSGGLLFYYAEAVPLLPESPYDSLYNTAAAGGLLSPTGKMSPTAKGKSAGRKAEKGVEPRGYVPLMGAVARVVVGGKYEHEFEVTLEGD